jgi:1-acyl-sn-glycerol-3-phosphate acyltransferase
VVKYTIEFFRVRGLEMDIWYSVTKGIVRTYMALFMDGVKVDGRENLPPGPKIIVGNHPHVTDSFVLPFIVQEKIHFFIQEETFTLPVLGKLLQLADQIPVVIGQGQDAIAIAREKLQMGNAVGIFPEGRLSGSREVRRAGAGAALLALETGVPLVPVGFYVEPKFIKEIKGKFHDRDTVGWWQFGGDVMVNIGEPWQLAVQEKTDRSYRYLRELTDKLMSNVQDLVDQAAKSFNY